MDVGNAAPHTLVIYRPSKRADVVLRTLAQTRGGRVTVLSLAPQEPASKGCCDTRSVLWNCLCRDLAHEHLTRALAAVDGQRVIEVAVLDHEGRRAVEAEARRLDATRIVLADPRVCGLGRRELRRLRASSPVPVVG